MAPLQKRKHSTRRKGKRIAAGKINLANLVICNNCKKPKLSHRICRQCGK